MMHVLSLKGTLLFLLICSIYWRAGFVFAGEFHNSHPSGKQLLEYDVVVYGATPAGIAAAISAAQLGATVALLETSNYVGGMAAPGGIGLRDIHTPERLRNQTIVQRWLQLNREHYRKLDSTVPSPAMNNINSTVFNNNEDDEIWQPDASVALANWKQMLTETAHLDTFLNTGLVENKPSIMKSGTVIQCIITVNTDSSVANDEEATWCAQQFVDASYEADIVLACNMSFTYGREARNVYNESLAGVVHNDTYAQFTHPVNPYWGDNKTLLYGVDPGPLAPEGSGDKRVMPFSYRLCLSKSSLKVPWPKPENYNTSDFELLIRYVKSLTLDYGPNGPPLDRIVSELPYEGYRASLLHNMKYNLCENGDSAVSADEPTLLYEDYILGNRSVRASVASVVKYWVGGLMYTLANDPQIPSDTQKEANKFGLCHDAWPENNYWPPQLYVREGVRIVGDRVTTQNSLVAGICLDDSIGLGDWTIDIHMMQRYVGQIGGQVSAKTEGALNFIPVHGNGTVYDLSYTLLLPKRSEVTNLLVPTSPSASHIAFGSIRVEPTFLQMGTAAGVAAILAIDQGVAVQDVDVKSLQAGIISLGQCIHWPGCFDCV